jgi:hypothetical protein
MKRSVALCALVLSVAGLAAAGVAAAHDHDDWGRGDRGRHEGRGPESWRQDRDDRGHGGYGYYRPAPRYYASPRYDYRPHREYHEYREYREYRRPRDDYYPDRYVYAEPDYPVIGLSLVLPLR